MADKDSGKKPCFCTTYSCNGQSVSRWTWMRHHNSDVNLKDLSQPNTTTVHQPSNLNIPIFPGSTINLREAITKKLLIFLGNNGVSKKALSQMFSVDKQTLPNSCLPGKYEDAIALIKHEFIPLQKVDVCPNDCILYRQYHDEKDYSTLQQCPVCKHDRYKSGSRKQPYKQFTYMPIGPRLQRWFGESSLAKLVYNGDISFNNEILQDFKDGQEYRKLFSSGGIFENDKAGGVPLGLFTDGLNPNRNQNIQYSMWPVLLTWFSLPAQFRTVLGPMMLYGIIPGNGRQEPKSLEPYMELIVDEILQLEGRLISNAYLSAPVSLKVRLVYFYCDIPAYSKLLHLSGQQALRACPYCESEAVYSKDLSKPIHTKNRRFLPQDDELRKADGFPEAFEDQPRPNLISCEKEKEWRATYDRLNGKSFRDQHAKKTGMKGQYALMKAPDHNRVSQMSPDGMHTLADVVCNILAIVSGKSDTAKVRKCEETHGRFPETWLQIAENPSKRQKTTVNQSRAPTLPPAPWSLDLDSKKEADQRVAKIKFPSGCDLKHHPYFTKPWQLDKMHTKLEFVKERVLTFCLRGLIGNRQLSTLIYFSDTLHDVMQTAIRKEDVPELQQRITKSVCFLERDFPLTLMNITTHLMHHVSDDLNKFGPLCSRWLFVLERTLCWISRQALNKKDPESTVMATYQIYDWAMFQLLTENKNLIAEDAEFNNLSRLPTLHEVVNKMLAPESEESEVQQPYKFETTMLGRKLIDMIIDGYRTFYNVELPSHRINPCVEKQPKLLRKVPGKKAPVILGSTMKDKGSARCDSYVTVRKDGQPHDSSRPVAVSEVDFAQVQFYFKTDVHVDRKPCANQWAKIKIFIAGHEVKDNFYKVNTTSSMDMVVPANSISQPYITYADNDNIWFINFRSV